MTIMYCPECKTYTDCKSSKNENVFRKDGESYVPKSECVRATLHPHPRLDASVPQKKFRTEDP